MEQLRREVEAERETWTWHAKWGLRAFCNRGKSKYGHAVVAFVRKTFRLHIYSQRSTPSSASCGRRGRVGPRGLGFRHMHDTFES